MLKSMAMWKTHINEKKGLSALRKPKKYQEATCHLRNISFVKRGEHIFTVRQNLGFTLPYFRFGILAQNLKNMSDKKKPIT